MTSTQHSHEAAAKSAPIIRIIRATLPLFVLAAGLQAAAPMYLQTNLVSDLPGVAKITDRHLIGGWGATHSPTSAWWVNSTLGGVAVVYDGAGQPSPAANPLVVTIPAPAGMTIPSIPTGIVANTGVNFNLTPNHPARFIFVTRTGTVSGWNPQVNPTNAMIVVPNPGNADYTGVAIAPRDGVDQLYVANFGQGRVDVFDGTFQPVVLPAGAFVDHEIPDTFSVFNVQPIGPDLYVTYARKNVFETAGDGPDQGHVTIFDANGTLLRRLKTGPWMNAPWAVVRAPADFGHFSNCILIGMLGDGGIAAFDPEKGNFQGVLRGTEQQPITLGRGLWGLGFGNGGSAGPTNTLYFAADIFVGNELHGLFGTLTPAR